MYLLMYLGMYLLMYLLADVLTYVLTYVLTDVLTYVADILNTFFLLNKEVWASALSTCVLSKWNSRISKFVLG
jgi:hypothetical protein